MHAARIEDTEHGRRPADDGWFVLNLAEMEWATGPGGGIWSPREAYADRPPVVPVSSPWPLDG